MCQEMPNGLYTRWEYDSKTDRFKARNNRTRNFENMVMSFYQELRPECKIQSFYTTGKQKKRVTVLMFMVTAITVKQYLKLLVATIISAHAKKLVHRCQNKMLKGEIRSEEWMS